MKRLIFVAPMLLAMSGLLYSQTKSSVQLSRDYIEISGAKLRLGMTTAEVGEKLSGADILKPGDNGWLVKCGQQDEECSLHFENGRLSFADRTWHGQDNDIVDALYGVVTYFNNEGHSVCSISTDTVPDPHMSLERVWIRCGDKTILILRTTIDGKTYHSVDEHLGALKRDSQ